MAVVAPVTESKFNPTLLPKNQLSASHCAKENVEIKNKIMNL
jgi:hypothetical protein